MSGELFFRMYAALVDPNGELFTNLRQEVRWNGLRARDKADSARSADAKLEWKSGVIAL